MSRIGGVVGKLTDDQIADRMLNTMRKNRYPIQECFVDTDCCLLFSGPEASNCKAAGEWDAIVFDGAIYNCNEVRKELLGLGYGFSSDSQAEVVLRAYMQWKEKSLLHLNGIFSFAIWSSKERTLFLARDRIGVKPLFYSHSDSVLYFGSEIKTILAHPDVPALINDQSVAQLLLLGPGRIQGSGVFKDILELKPGHYAQFSDGKLSVHQYWKLTDREHEESFEETAEHVRYLLLDAISRQLDGLEEIGAFLSGGLDSSIVSRVCFDICQMNGLPLKTFSVDYKDQEKYFTANKFQPETDRYYIELMRTQIHSQHHDVFLSPDDLIKHLDDATIARDLPGMGDVDFSLLAFCNHIGQHVNVALSGECADEIFGGYPWYRDPEIRATEGFPWAQNTQFRAGFIRPEFLENLNPNDYIMDLYRSTINRSDILPGTNRINRRTKELVNLNFDWFMQTLLDRNDRMSTHYGLDVRVPYCDYRIAEYLYAVPWEMKDHGNKEKGLLRYAMRGLIPEQVLYRKKSPYPKTFDPQYTKNVIEKLKEVLDDPNSPILSIVRKDALEKLMTAKFDWPWYGQLMRLPQTIAFMLQMNRWMDIYKVKIV